jgi:hypothetical protein
VKNNVIVLKPKAVVDRHPEIDTRLGEALFVAFAIAPGPAIPRIRALPDELPLSARCPTFGEWPIITKKSYNP